MAIIGPDTMYDLQEDEAFVKVSQYQDKENIYTGEVGRLFGVRLVETTEAKIFEGAGASGADVASVIVLGQYAYGVTSLKGAKPRVIVKPAGSAGTADPLDQISTCLLYTSCPPNVSLRRGKRCGMIESVKEGTKEPS